MMITVILVILAPVSVLVFPEPYNGIAVSFCIGVIAFLEWKRDAAQARSLEDEDSQIP